MNLGHGFLGISHVNSKAWPRINADTRGSDNQHDLAPNAPVTPSFHSSSNRPIQDGEPAPVCTKPVRNFTVVADLEPSQVGVFTRLYAALSNCHPKRMGPIDCRRGN